MTGVSRPLPTPPEPVESLLDEEDYAILAMEEDEREMGDLPDEDFYIVKDSE